MAITVSTPKRKSKSTSGSGSSSGRVAANSYGTGDKYVGGTTMKRADGSTYEISGEYTSPSGKVSYTDNDGNITTISSKDKSQNGTIYSKNPDGSYSSNYSEKVQKDYARDYADMQVDALREAMGANTAALEAAYKQSTNQLDNSISDAKRQAYVNQQRAMKNLPQTMAAAGYTGGITETTAANIANEYQNALTDLDRTKAEEYARLAADKANGIANIETNYNAQIANALQQAAQFEQQQRQYEEEMQLRRQAAALEQQKYLDGLNNVGTGSKPRLTYEQTVEQIQAGNGSDVVRDAAEYYGLQDIVPTSTQFSNKYLEDINNQLLGMPSASTGIKYVNRLLNEGNITPNEAATLANDIIRRYGG